MTYLIKNVLIERLEKNLSFGEKTPIYINHQNSVPFGFATIRKDGDLYVADLDVPDMKCDLLYPSVGVYYGQDGSGAIVQLGLCTSPNIDKEIKPIKFTTK